MSFAFYGKCFAMFWSLVFTAYVYLGIAGLAPQASYSLSTATKSNQTNFAGCKIEQLFFSWPVGQNTGRVL